VPNQANLLDVHLNNSRLLRKNKEELENNYPWLFRQDLRPTTGFSLMLFPT
jgi:hypothetical protein